MAGGTWTSQNKPLPGVYINVHSAGGSLGNASDRGVVTLCKPMSWGPVGQVMTIEAGQDVTDILGYDVNTAAQLLFLREIFLGTEDTSGACKALLYRPAGDQAAAASAKIGDGDSALTITARYPGVRGNDISLSIQADPDGENTYLVRTMVDGAVKDEQRVTDLGQLKENAWVGFSGAGTPSAAAATALAGGTDGTVSAAAYSDYLTAIEPYTFQALIYDGTDDTVKAAMTAFVKRLRETEGVKVSAVMSNTTADYEGVISVRNGLVLSNGTQLTPEQATWWIGGATAGANYDQSLTFRAHPGAIDVSPRLTRSQLEATVNEGQIALFEEDGKVKIVTDINTLTTYTAAKSKDFRKNRVIRVLDAIANDIYRIFSAYYIGKVDNNATGRDLLKKEIVGLLNTMQGNGGVQNFAADDVTVEPGGDKDAVLVHLAVQPVDAVEKIYVDVTVS